MAKTMTRDLTVGSPTKLVAGFMLPLWGGMLFQALSQVSLMISSASRALPRMRPMMARQ